MFNIIKKTEDNTTTLFLEGRLDTNTAPELEKALADMIDTNDLIMDFEKLAYVSSAGLRVLLIAQKKMNSLGGMKIVKVTEAVMEILEITGFADILDIE